MFFGISDYLAYSIIRPSARHGRHTVFFALFHFFSLPRLHYARTRDILEGKFIFNPNQRNGIAMETRVAVLAILAESFESAEQINTLLHDFGPYIVGRMGLPYRERNVNVISIVIDAPPDKINALAGKLGRIEGVTAKAVYSNVITTH